MRIYWAGRQQAEINQLFTLIYCHPPSPKPAFLLSPIPFTASPNDSSFSEFTHTKKVKLSFRILHHNIHPPPSFLSSLFSSFLPLPAFLAYCPIPSRNPLSLNAFSLTFYSCERLCFVCFFVLAIRERTAKFFLCGCSLKTFIFGVDRKNIKEVFQFLKRNNKPLTSF